MVFLTLLSFSPSWCGNNVRKLWKPAFILCIRLLSFELAISLRNLRSWSWSPPEIVKSLQGKFHSIKYLAPCQKLSNSEAKNWFCLTEFIRNWRQLTGLRPRLSFWPSRRQNSSKFVGKIWRFFETAAAKIAFVV